MFLHRECIYLFLIEKSRNQKVWFPTSPSCAHVLWSTGLLTVTNCYYSIHRATPAESHSGLICSPVQHWAEIYRSVNCHYRCFSVRVSHYIFIARETFQIRTFWHILPLIIKRLSRTKCGVDSFVRCLSEVNHSASFLSDSSHTPLLKSQVFATGRLKHTNSDPELDGPLVILPAVSCFILRCAFTSTASSTNVTTWIITRLGIYFCLSKRSINIFLFLSPSAKWINNLHLTVHLNQHFWSARKCLYLPELIIDQRWPDSAPFHWLFKTSPTRAAVGDVGKAHCWKSPVRFTNICCLSSRLLLAPDQKTLH